MSSFHHGFCEASVALFFVKGVFSLLYFVSFVYATVVLPLFVFFRLISLFCFNSFSAFLFVRRVTSFVLALLFVLRFIVFNVLKVAFEGD